MGTHLQRVFQSFLGRSNTEYGKTYSASHCVWSQPLPRQPSYVSKIRVRSGPTLMSHVFVPLLGWIVFWISAFQGETKRHHLSRRLSRVRQNSRATPTKVNKQHAVEMFKCAISPDGQATLGNSLAEELVCTIRMRCGLTLMSHVFVSLLHWMREVKSANKRPNSSKWPSRVKRNSRLRLPKVSKQHEIEMFS